MVAKAPPEARVQWPTDNRASTSDYDRGYTGGNRYRGTGRGRSRGRGRGRGRVDGRFTRVDNWDYKKDRPHPRAGKLDERRPYERGIADGPSE